jgi:hypothetical protein
MTVFWDAAACRVVEVYRRFRRACCHHHDNKTSVNFHQTGRSTIPEDNFTLAAVRTWNITRLMLNFVFWHGTRQDKRFCMIWRSDGEVKGSVFQQHGLLNVCLWSRIVFVFLKHGLNQISPNGYIPRLITKIKTPTECSKTPLNFASFNLLFGTSLSFSQSNFTKRWAGPSPPPPPVTLHSRKFISVFPSECSVSHYCPCTFCTT